MSGDDAWSRAEVIRRVGLAGLVVAGGAPLLRTADAFGSESVIRPADSRGSGYRVYRSRPSLRPPLITVDTKTAHVADGLLFLAPNSGPGQRGVLIADSNGEPVWFRRTFPRTAMNFRPAIYKGKPVLTWWEGNTARGLGKGDHVIVDRSYKEIARFGSGHGLESDLHELLITRRNTALITSWDSQTRDLTKAGGTSRHGVIGGLIQEIEIASGRVLFEWNSQDHVAISESYQGVGPSFDYFHINSIDVDADGNFLVSARNTWALYKIDRDSGKVLWRMGGKKSDFDMGPGTHFAWQHDARHHGPGDKLISLFTNNAGPPATEAYSRAMILSVDHAKKRVRRVRNYYHYRKNVLAFAMGSAQRLHNGNMLVGWGTAPYFTEFTKAGLIAWDAHLPHGGQNYRIFRAPWVGRPSDEPRLVVKSTTAGKRLYVSWNGATEVASWQLRAGTRSGDLSIKSTGRKRAFETMLTAPKGARFAQVAALDARGKVLGLSKIREL